MRFDRLLILTGIAAFSIFGYAAAQDATQDTAQVPVQDAGAAQNPAAQPADQGAAPAVQEIVVMPPEESINPNEMASLLFTHWEHTAIMDARRMRGMARPPTEEELARDLKTGVDGEKVKPPPEEREISLGGIVYLAQNDWTIWLNGKRITPDALPKEALDLKVHDGYIEVKWFDEYNNEIYPVRLRPHQRFNMDTRIFLPG